MFFGLEIKHQKPFFFPLINLSRPPTMWQTYYVLDARNTDKKKKTGGPLPSKYASSSAERDKGTGSGVAGQFLSLTTQALNVVRLGPPAKQDRGNCSTLPGHFFRQPEL